VGEVKGTKSVRIPEVRKRAEQKEVGFAQRCTMKTERTKKGGKKTSDKGSIQEEEKMAKISRIAGAKRRCRKREAKEKTSFVKLYGSRKKEGLWEKT